MARPLIRLLPPPSDGGVVVAPVEAVAVAVLRGEGADDGEGRRGVLRRRRPDDDDGRPPRVVVPEGLVDVLPDVERLRELLADAGQTGAAAQVLRVPLTRADDGPRVLLLVGVGRGSPRDLRRAGAALAKQARSVRSLATYVADAEPGGSEDDTTAGPAEGAAAGRQDVALQAHVEGLLLASYEFARRSTPDPRASRLQRVDVVTRAGRVWSGASGRSRGPRPSPTRPRSAATSATRRAGR